MTQDMTAKTMTRDNKTAARRHLSCPLLRSLLLMMMMVVGVSGVKGQTVDYSGTYYIASSDARGGTTSYYNSTTPENSFYLCQTDETSWICYVDPDNYTNPAYDNDQPFLTTHKYRAEGEDPTEAQWIIEKVPNTEYYHIIHRKTGRYLTYNGTLKNTTGRGVNRLRFHLQSTVNDNSLFQLVQDTDKPASINIIAVAAVGVYYYNDGGLKNCIYLNISSADDNSLIGTNGKTDGPTGYKNIGGTIGIWHDPGRSSEWYLEETIPTPIITQQDDNTITITYPGSEMVTLYYTTDDSRPDPANVGGSNPTQIYSGTPIAMTNPVTTVKAIAVKTKDNDEALDIYSRCVTLTTHFYIGSNYPYLLQSVECTDFHMMPGDVSSGNTTVNTSSLFRSTMAWTFTSAGYEGGVQYYYIKNGTDYLFRSSDNIYLRSSSVFDDATDKTGYKFFIEKGYDADSNPDGYCIIPKGVTNNTYCLFKSGYKAGPPEVLANGDPDVVKGGTNARAVKRGRWNIITYSAPGNVLSSSLVTSDASNPTYFKIENVGTTGQFMSSPAIGNVGTATSGNDALAWYILEAGSDSERKYYYIVHQSGKYLKFNKATTVTTNQSNVLDFLDYDDSTSDRYQFVFAKSTTDGAYYIVPKGLEDVTKSQYYALYLDGTNPIKSNKNRQSDSYKWKLVPFCANPVFEKSGENITLTCTTTTAEIHFTNNGTDPDENATTYSSTNWASSTQVCIKAIGVIKEGGEVVSKSEIVTLLNNPTVTLESGAQVYDGKEKKPEVNSVSVGTISAPKPPTETATYKITYNNNINAGVNTASVTITDVDEDDNDSKNDNWYIWNVQPTYFTIDKKMLTVTADDKEVEYGSPAPDNYSISYSGFVHDESLQDLTTIPTATCSGYTTTSAMGSTFPIVPSGGEDENYSFNYVNGTLTVVPKSVTLTANSGTVTYNGTEQTLTGFTSSVEGLTFTGVSASGSGTNVRAYDVTFSGVTLNTTTDDTGNYRVTSTVDGTLTINPASATVTADDKTKTYGDADPTLTATVTGMVNNESADLLTYTFSRVEGENVNTYTITPAGDAVQGNYSVSYATGTLTISKKGLTITAKPWAITYGDAPANDGVTYSGFITSENENTAGVLTGTLAYAYTYEQYGHVSDESHQYTITPSGLTSTNYDVAFVAGTLTVNPKSIGSGSLASGFTLEFREGGAIILKDGENTLSENADYSINQTISHSGRYSSKNIIGTENYTGYFAIRNTIVNFQTDEDRVEWSATFVAEPVGADLDPPVAADNTKGHKLPEGISAYIITAINGDWAIPEALDYIPEGVPVLLLSNSDVGGFLVEEASGHTSITSAQISSNMLEATSSTTHFNVRTIYLLHENEFVYNMDGDLAAGKVYLNPGHSTPAPSRLKIKWNTETGLEDSQLSTLNPQCSTDIWYALDGRRLNDKPAKKGLYLSNGQKMVVR